MVFKAVLRFLSILQAFACISRLGPPFSQPLEEFGIFILLSTSGAGCPVPANNRVGEKKPEKAILIFFPQNHKGKKGGEDGDEAVWLRDGCKSIGRVLFYPFFLSAWRCALQRAAPPGGCPGAAVPRFPLPARSFGETPQPRGGDAWGAGRGLPRGC